MRLMEDHGARALARRSVKKAPKGGKDKATKENKLAKWLKKEGSHVAEIAEKALTPRQMAHFA